MFPRGGCGEAVLTIIRFIFGYWLLVVGWLRLRPPTRVYCMREGAKEGLSPSTCQQSIADLSTDQSVGITAIKTMY